MLLLRLKVGFSVGVLLDRVKILKMGRELELKRVRLEDLMLQYLDLQLDLL